MNYKIYDNYKDSNEKWIGVVPESWVVKPIREFYDYRSEKVSDKVYAPLSVTKKGILPQLEHAAKTDNNDSRKKVKIGDFVINSRSDRKGSCGVSPYEGSVSLIYHVLKSKDSSIDKYAHHLFRSVMFAEEFYKWGHGIVDDLWSTRWDEMKKIKIPMPPKDERIYIGQFLDKKTNMINEQIKLNEELIQLLEEKRVALINQVVTKGLNPDVAMKDSGVKWIGEIPEHWEIRKFGHLIKLITKGATPTSYGFDFQDEGINFIKVESIEKNGKFIPSKFNYISQECNNFLSRSKMKEGDLLFSIAGALGRVAIVDSTILPANTNQALSIIRIDASKLLVEYVFYALKSDYSMYQIEDNTVQSAQANLSMESIKEFKILIPSFKEQYELVDYLNKETLKIDSIVHKVQENIALLEEYKTSLIHHVVTGKIDVRGEEI